MIWAAVAVEPSDFACRLDPLERRLAAGCTFTQRIAELISGAGFEITELDEFYGEATPRFAGAYSLGRAVNAG